MTISRYKITDIIEGTEIAFKKKVLETDVDAFVRLSGDISPLHISDEFSRARGFQGRVVHGALLVSYLSKIIGVDFPGENALVQNISIHFNLPVYINDELDFQLRVDQVSAGTDSFVLKVKILRAEDVVAKAKVVIGLTHVR